jgi:D-alanyl-D-alanine carboxypeptidase (penicillin-binding protein 5/6)
MNQPVLAEIVAQKTADLPVANTIKNVNFLLGTSNIIGVKTGNTEQAGGVFVGAARKDINGKPVTFVTAVAGAPDLFTSMKYSLNLIESAQTNIEQVRGVSKQQSVGMYRVPWSSEIKAVAAEPTLLSAWRKSSVNTSTKLQSIKPTARKNNRVGAVTTSNGPLGTRSESAVVLAESVPEPSLFWKVTHPFN